VGNSLINDLGILYYISNNYSTAKLKIFLGRILSRNRENCTWHEHILRNESDFIKDVIYSNNVNSKIKELFKKEFSSINFLSKTNEIVVILCFSFIFY
jgi:hypothetical protein